ncbi:Outer membrane protein TolC [Granulicella rosea]|uniref:Outer membrane protein TolC n=1 Tax=Granulicella rosea TaxID=474952 RepID=A0A239H1P0_9BACT|nr:TolC family protein [Granulicella rosea]SNS74174.1 Outer membrane protein TolC [Granulicella rosea]
MNAATRSSARLAGRMAGLALLTLAGASAQAQISFTAAVDMALKNSPQVRMAESDVMHARAAIDEAIDVYIPTVVGATSGLGYAYGFPLGPPTIYSFTAQSLVFSYSQKDYVRSARSGLVAANFALKDVRSQVAEDAATTYISLDRAQRQRAALAEELGYAEHLQSIVQDRLDAGRDTKMELTRSRRTGVQLRLQLLQLDDEIANSADHLARLIGLPGNPLTTVSDSIPEVPHPSGSFVPAETPGVKAAFATAKSKYERAFGDDRYRFRPQFAFGAEYSRFSTFNNQYVKYYPSVSGLESNAVGFSVNVTIPLFDKSHEAKARESMAEAVHAQNDAIYHRDQAQEGQLKLRHSMAELSAKSDLASLDKELAEEQLEAILVQLQAPAVGGAAALTPKDEQNARIQERQRYVEMLDAEGQLRQTGINLLRQTGELEGWLKISAGSAAASSNSLASPSKP